MKALLPVLAAGLLSLSACSPALTPLSKEATSTSTFNKTSAGETQRQTLTMSAPTGDPRNAAGQTLLLHFSQPIDATTVSSAFSFYKLASAADNYTAYVATALATPTFTVTGSDVLVTLDLSTSTALLEMRVKADVLKGLASDGDYFLDPNGNNIPGETGELEIQEITVGTNSAVGASAPAAVTIGASRDPNQTVPVSLGGFLSSNQVVDLAGYSTAALATSLGISWTDTGSAAAPNNNKVTVDAGALKVYKNIAGVWTLQTVTATSSTTNRDTILNLSPTRGEAYKIQLTPYLVFESQAVADFIHRGSYDSSSYTTQYITFASGTTVTATSPTLARGAGSNDGTYNRQLYVDVTVAANQFVDWTTVTAATIKVRVNSDVVYLNGSALDDTDTLVTVTAAKLETASGDNRDTQVRRFRLWLPESLRDVAGAGFTGAVFFAPSVLTTNTGTATLDKLSFGAVSSTYDGWRRVTF